MAERRMFAKTIIDSDAFLEMPLSTQALYFHLSMRADDDGFINNPKKIQRMIGSMDDDLKLLFVKNFLIPFDSGVVVIKHWKIHNYIRNDRYKETVYQEEKAMLMTKENKAYTLGIPNGYQTDTQYRIGKDRIGKDSIVEGEARLLPSGQMSGQNSPEIEKEIETEKEIKKIDYQLIADMYNDTCVSFPRVQSLSEKRKKAIKARLKQYTVEDFKLLFTKAEASSFLKGGNDRDWSANFDWLIMDGNMAKVLSGNYDSKPKKPAAVTKSAAAYNSYQQRQYSNDEMTELERKLLGVQAPPDTAGNNPEIQARAEALQERLKG